ncbi:hypothetical protein [Natronobacterium texcoconense]|uniref:Uncharacterized protein n=1 Tax=Natronobacterium texcoconense TaxID=1095778 RepID=A0A1H1I2V8_NATTX|nr:hypothetical protein [Natronobacterium texcoconense]SDR32000.1 hypothetical protein SAMN04489842_3270 [Natronobacterium texcoconense]
MTDTDTDADTDTDSVRHRFRTSRRTFLGVALASPAALGIGVTSYRAAAQPDSADSYDTGLVCELADTQDDLEGDQHAISADPRLLDAYDCSVGDQFRIERTDGDFAAYTVVESRPEAPQEIVRMSDGGKFRLDLADEEWSDEDDLNSCPSSRTDHSLGDEFEAALSTTVPRSDLSIDEARLQGELVERLDEGEASLVAIAPHGGGMQPWTDEQAARVGELASATSWRALGWGPTPEGGAFRRWYVPSTQISPSSYPKLAEIVDDDFDVAVDFGGVCESGIEVAGTADESLRAEVRDSINEMLPSCAVEATLPDEPDGTADSMLVNRLGDDGIFISQSYATRRAYWDPIATGVAAALSDDVSAESVSIQSTSC